MTADRLQLHRGCQRAELDLVGGRVASYRVHGKEVLASEEHGATATYRSALLAPWPNRVANGRWRWEGEDLQLPVNEVPPGNALHGLVAFASFEADAVTEDSARLVHDLPASSGYPFALRLEATYTLTTDGLACVLEAMATGNRTTPVALGVHPYLLARGPVDDIELAVPADLVVQVDEHWEETGRGDVSRTDLDLRGVRRIGTQDIDACFTGLQRDPDGRVRCRVVLPEGDEIVVWGGNTARHIVVYTSHTLPGDSHRSSLAVEPVTAPANALRSGNDLAVLEPGERLILEWGLSPSWLTD